MKNNSNNNEQDDNSLVACPSCGKLCFGKCADCLKSKIDISDNIILNKNNSYVISNKNRNMKDNNLLGLNKNERLNKKVIGEGNNTIRNNSLNNQTQDFANDFLLNNHFLLKRNNSQKNFNGNAEHMYNKTYKNHSFSSDYLKQNRVPNNDLFGRSLYDEHDERDKKQKIPQNNTTIKNIKNTGMYTQNTNPYHNLMHNKFVNQSKNIKKTIVANVHVDYSLSSDNFRRIMKSNPGYTHFDVEDHLLGIYLTKKRRL